MQTGNPLLFSPLRDDDRDRDRDDDHDHGAHHDDDDHGHVRDRDRESAQFHALNACACVLHPLLRQVLNDCDVLDFDHEHGDCDHESDHGYDHGYDPVYGHQLQNVHSQIQLRWQRYCLA